MGGSAISKKSTGSNANFKVVLRIRPLSQKEKQSKEDVCLKPQSATVLAITKSKETFDKKSRETQHTFTYDRMYHDNEDQETVFSSAVEPVVLSTLEGYNGSIIAYGQTGTGKTYPPPPPSVRARALLRSAWNFPWYTSYARNQW